MIDLLLDQVAPSVSALSELVNTYSAEIRETHCVHLTVTAVALIGKPLLLYDPEFGKDRHILRLVFP
jgi:hypothetical protein